MATIAKDIALWARTRAQALRIDASRQRATMVSLATEDDPATIVARMAFIDALEAAAVAMDECANKIEHG